LRVELEAGWKLPEQRAQLLLELKESRGKEIRQGRLDVPQATYMGHEARPLHAEDEAFGRVGIPVRIALRRLQRIERPIDLDAAHCAGSEPQFVLLYQALGVEVTSPRGVAPA